MYWKQNLKISIFLFLNFTKSGAKFFLLVLRAPHRRFFWREKNTTILFYNIVCATKRKMKLTKLILTDSPTVKVSELLKQKFCFLNTRKNNNKKYFIENQVLNQWLKWKKSEDQKSILALEIGYKDYVIWNMKILKNHQRWLLLSKACISGLTHMVNLISEGEKEDNCWHHSNIIYGACRGGNIELVNLVIAKGTYDWNSGLSGACRGNNLELANLMITKGADCWQSGMYSACRGGNIELVNLIINKADNDNALCNIIFNQGLLGACKGGNLELANLMITKGARTFNAGLKMACCTDKSRNNNVIELMIAKGATNWNRGLIQACIYGNEEIIELMISKGANNINDGFKQACGYGNEKIVKLMISKGANNFNDCLIRACSLYSVEIVELLIARGANNLNEGLTQACLAKNKEIIELLIAKGANNWNEPQLRNIMLEIGLNDANLERITNRVCVNY